MSGRDRGRGDYLAMSVGEFLDAVSATGPAPATGPGEDTGPGPGGGSAAALSVALAASLCVMSASLSSRHLPAAERVVAQARALRERVEPLAQADADGYREVLASRPGPDRAAALSRACAVPMEVAASAARAADIAATLASDGNPSVRGDAITAALLAAAGARAAAALVEINLAGTAGDDRRAHAAALAGEAARLAAVAARTAEGGPGVPG